MTNLLRRIREELRDRLASKGTAKSKNKGKRLAPPGPPQPAREMPGLGDDQVEMHSDHGGLVVGAENSQNYSPPMTTTITKMPRFFVRPQELSEPRSLFHS